ncbi:LPXTG cell wall anchor domain-containing protein [Lacrimispora saccharolytica]|nr:LPXTG cell wall anchor domain-containing protein [Lacrimispora saccharolytica]
MKKIKKIFALLMTVAMVMGLNVTAFADQVKIVTSDITVKNLATDVETTVTVLNVVYYDKTTEDNGVEKQSWVVVDWAQKYIKYNGDTEKYEIVSGKEEEFKQAAETASSDESNVSFRGKTNIGKGEVVFEGVPVGAYVILASDSKNTYNLMVAETYKDGETYMTAEDATVIAKPNKYITDKKDDDNLVKRGQKVNFTVTSYVPAKSKQTEKGSEPLKQFIITDEPQGLQVTGVSSIKIGTKEVLSEIDIKTVVENTEPTWDPEKKGTILITNSTNDNLTAETKKVEMNLLGIVNQENNDGSEKYPAGSTITIQYSATVKDEIEYNNVISTNCNTVNYEPDEEDGFEASIEVMKVAEVGQTPLTGAQFEVTDMTNNNEKLYFVKITDGVYKLALNGESGASTTVEVGADQGNEGNLTLKGLDESEYLLTEIQAPNGYSGGVTKTVKIEVNGDGTAPVVTYGENSQNIVNTKLTALPSTGSIGTTIFTIGGCVIMIAAAGLFFATRKKAEK